MALSSGSTAPASSVTTLPQQVVNAEGTIYVPFAGRIAVTGKDVQQVAAEITHQLQGRANQPQVLVRLYTNNTNYVTVVGEVTNSTRLPLSSRKERLLDALAAAGGTRQPAEKTTLQITRGAIVDALPLDVVIRDPRQSIALQPGDVLTALLEPLSFTALGASGKTDEIYFEAQGISLAQALARSGGQLDSRSNAQGVFIFRFEQQEALKGVQASVATPDGRIPVVYRFDLKDPKTFFVAQNFLMQNKDVLYVANAPAAQLQKFLNLLLATINPVEGAVNLTK